MKFFCVFALNLSDFPNYCSVKMNGRQPKSQNQREPFCNRKMMAGMGIVFKKDGGSNLQQIASDNGKQNGQGGWTVEEKLGRKRSNGRHRSKQDQKNGA